MVDTIRKTDHAKRIRIRTGIGRFVALYRQGKLPVDQLLTGRLSLDQINLGFDRLARGEAIRQVIMMEG